MILLNRIYIYNMHDRISVLKNSNKFIQRSASFFGCVMICTQKTQIYSCILQSYEKFALQLDFQN
jgi:lipopolysaccharide export system protein LptA